MKNNLVLILCMIVNMMAVENDPVLKIQKSLDSLNKISNTSDFQKGEKEGFQRSLNYCKKLQIQPVSPPKKKSISSPQHAEEIRLLEGNGFIVLSIGGCAMSAKTPLRTTKFKVEKNGQIMEGYIAKEGSLFIPRKVIYFF